MPEETYKQLVDEKFKRVYAQMDANFGLIHTKLDSIHCEVKKTNGRVNQLEEKIHDVEIHEAKGACPNTPIVEDLSKKEIKNSQIRRAFYWVVGLILAGAVTQILSATGVI